LTAPPAGMPEPEPGLRQVFRRSCTDVAARMRLPSWEQLRWEMAAPLAGFTVADLLEAWIARHLAVAAAFGAKATRRDELPDSPTEAVVEAVRLALRAMPPDGLPAEATAEVHLAVAEAVVLGWDLQRTIGAGAGPDPRLVEAAMGWVDELNGKVWPGLDPIGTGPLAGATDLLLAGCGRPVGAWAG